MVGMFVFVLCVVFQYEFLRRKSTGRDIYLLEKEYDFVPGGTLIVVKLLMVMSLDIFVLANTMRLRELVNIPP